MTLIERVRAVLSAGTPGPLYVIGSTLRSHTSKTRVDSFSSFEDTAQAALAVNLAPAFVALWAAAETWAKALEQTATCRDEFGWNEVGVQACAEWQDAEDTAALAVVRALAALNEAATREVGA